MAARVRLRLQYCLDTGRAPPHVPFADSRLTALLAGALGGDSKTVVLVTADPSPNHATETLQVAFARSVV